MVDIIEHLKFNKLKGLITLLIVLSFSTYALAQRTSTTGDFEYKSQDSTTYYSKINLESEISKCLLTDYTEAFNCYLQVSFELQKTTEDLSYFKYYKVHPGSCENFIDLKNLNKKLRNTIVYTNNQVRPKKFERERLFVSIPIFIK